MKYGVTAPVDSSPLHEGTIILFAVVYLKEHDVKLEGHSL